jgi:galactokinase
MLAADGVIGARQAGAGLGGCIVGFVEGGKTPGCAAAVRQAYSTTTGVTPDIYPVEAASGAAPIGDTYAS